ncbi:copper homeostasis protein CutC [Lentimicrobium sp. S6]|uniref:copper homeostasis protein CutC n=1 Tax=Lentimicrobium sp. S6 TaxID=2735872 RepID=UPI0020A6BE2E|nr:copper homeostasis protein CutC [Lentimicrobium sp. S6]
MKYPFEIEVCCDSWQSTQIAYEAGVNRVELCSGIGEGGLTPSLGLIQLVMQKLAIQTHVLIRPRSGDFLYSPEEIEIMERDVEACRNMGVHGVVIGFLLANGDIDVNLTKRFISLAGHMKVTFHRAFDMCKDPIKALEELKELGIDYVLTSGQAAKAKDGESLISELVKKSDGKIKIMPGSGVRAHNLEELMKNTQAPAYHMSARIKTDSKMEYKKTSVAMGAQSLDDEYKISTHSLEDLKLAMSLVQK